MELFVSTNKSREHFVCPTTARVYGRPNPIYTMSVYTDEAHRRQRSAIQRRQASGPRAGHVHSGRETVAALGQAQRRTANQDAPVAPVGANRVCAGQRDCQVHRRGECRARNNRRPSFTRLWRRMGKITKTQFDGRP